MKSLNLAENFPVIETDRFILREYRITDAEDLFEYAKDPEVSKYMSWNAHKSIEDTLKFLNDFMFATQYRQNIPEWAIQDKMTGKVIGGIGIVGYKSRDKIVELGYLLNRSYWGQGIMTEALRSVIKFIFENLDINRIEGYYRTDNPASGSVMAKASMQCEGVLRRRNLIKDQFRDMKLYSIVREEYERKIVLSRQFHPNFRVTVEGVIVKNGKILLTKRANDVYVLPGIWCVPAGKAEFEELPRDAVIREIEEETTLKTEVIKEFNQYSWQGTSADGEPVYRLMFTYLLKQIDENDEVKIDSEHSEFSWVRKKELEDSKYDSLLPELRNLFLKEIFD